MAATEKIISFIRNSFDTVLYFAVMCVKENFRNYISRTGTVGRPAPTMAILGNGPSLGGELEGLMGKSSGKSCGKSDEDAAKHQIEGVAENLSEAEFDNPVQANALSERDFMAVNFFADDERFEILRPKYYVLSDPMFFRDSAMRTRVEEFYATLNSKVTWPMNLYVQYYNPEKFDYRAVLPNPNIRIVRFHTQVYRGFRGVGFRLWRHGLGSANFGTVVQVGEYIAMLLGYKNIELYGVDHTLLDGLCIDDENRLCRLDRHYYDKGDVAPQPVYMKVPHKPYTMAEYLSEVAELFRGHEYLRDYAAWAGVRIINCTEGSLIDAYERQK